MVLWQATVSLLSTLEETRTIPQHLFRSGTLRESAIPTRAVEIHWGLCQACPGSVAPITPHLESITVGLGGTLAPAAVSITV